MSFHLGKPLLVMLVVACICGGAIWVRPPQKRTDLTVWTFADSHYKTYGQLVESFERETGATVGLDLVQTRALRIRLTSSFMTDQGSDLPDLVEVEIGMIGQFFRPPLAGLGFWI
jgi:hypothetical protein